MAVHHPGPPEKAAPEWGAAPPRPSKWSSAANAGHQRVSPRSPAHATLNEALGSYAPQNPQPAHPTPPPAPEPSITQSPAPEEDDEFVTLRIPRAILAQLVKETLMNQNNANTNDSKQTGAEEVKKNETSQTAAGAEANADTTQARSTEPSPGVVAQAKSSVKNLPWSKIGKVAVGTVGTAALAVGSFFLARKYGVRIPGLKTGA